jgi:hypothetical protein
MPLDLGQPHLADVASWVGITPVPNDVLEQHKRAEVAKRPGSWLYRYHAVASIVLPLSFMGLVVATGFLLLMAIVTGYATVSLSMFGGAVAFLMIGIAFTRSEALSSTGLRVYGPARWHEFAVYDLNALMNMDVPWEIRQLAAKILRFSNSNDDIKIVYGKLIQNYKVVDPYLVMRRGDDQIVLGIWDEHRIIHIASEV